MEFGKNPITGNCLTFQNKKKKMYRVKDPELDKTLVTSVSISIIFTLPTPCRKQIVKIRMLILALDACNMHYWQ